LIAEIWRDCGDGSPGPETRPHIRSARFASAVSE
jgi:hypothetical protein